MTASLLKVSGLAHKYSEDWALQNINFEIDDYGVVGLLGTNGAGKSTLMNIICGCLSQTQGSVTIEGLDGRTKPLELRRRIGFLPQQAPLSLELTIEEYLKFCASARGMRKKDASEAVDAVMEWCGLTSMRKRLISNLSGGYRQRTGIAQAVVHRPRLVVLDEPTVGLDPNQLLGLRELILDIGKERTVVFSTHILSEVEALCREVLMVEQGKIVFHNHIEAFRTVVEPSALILVAHKPPSKSVLERAFAEIETVESIGPKKLRIHHTGGRAFASKILKLSQENEWIVEEIYFEQSSLEDVFVSFTNGGSR